MRILNEDISAVSEDYFSSAAEEEFIFELRSAFIEQYLRYLVYKIVNYVLVFYGPSVTKGVFEWMRDDINDYYFVNAFDVEF